MCAQAEAGLVVLTATPRPELMGGGG
eukprot:SAG25_NODE_8266_length_430_cov_2.033233_1_plen_25_part_10